MNKSLPDLDDKPYGGAWPIYDKDAMIHLSNFKYKGIDTMSFLNNYKDWAFQGHNLQDINAFSNLAFCNGTTETFDKFYHKHMNKRLRLFKGEYFYHQMMGRICKSFAWVHDDDIFQGDVFVVSVPFSDTGNVPEELDSLLQACEDNNVPVLLDMAYINISKPIQVNLNYSCIECITTSLSKTFPVENYRIGLRLQRNKVDDTLYAYLDNEYINHHSISLGQYFIENYSNTFIVDKYQKAQEEYCKELNVEQSQCVIFGLDSKQQYAEYNRGGDTNRLCFSRVWDGRAVKHSSDHRWW